VPTSSRCSRRDDRHVLSRDLNARVEFDYPAGKLWSLPIVDFSVAGLSFSLDRGRPPMECGSRLSEVKVHIGDAAIAGDLAILHVTRDAESGTVCGALFHPSTQEEQTVLKTIIDRINAT